MRNLPMINVSRLLRMKSWVPKVVCVQVWLVVGEVQDVWVLRMSFLASLMVVDIHLKREKYHHLVDSVDYAFNIHIFTSRSSVDKTSACREVKINFTSKHYCNTVL